MIMKYIFWKDIQHFNTYMMPKIPLLKMKGSFGRIFWNLFLKIIFYSFNLKIIFKNKFQKMW